MNITKFVNFLNKSKKLNIDASYYSYIDNWRYWWQGYVESIHKVKEVSADGSFVGRRLATLRMPKHACEDWATLLLNDKTRAVIKDKDSAEWLLGSDDQTGGILRTIDFWTKANELVEKTFRSGTGAFVMSVEGMVADKKNGTVPIPGNSSVFIYPFTLLLPCLKPGHLKTVLNFHRLRRKSLPVRLYWFSVHLLPPGCGHVQKLLSPQSPLPVP